VVAGKLRQQERLTPVPRRPEHEVDFFRESALAEIETDENIRCQEDGTGAIKHVPCPAYQFPGVERVDILQPPHRWLKPGVEDRRTQFAKKIPHPVAPPKLLLVGARGHEIQGTRKIDA